MFKIKRKVFGVILVFILLVNVETNQKVEAMAGESIPFLITMIGNQIIEIISMIVEINEQVERFKSLSKFPKELYEDYIHPMSERMDMLDEIGEVLIKDAQELIYASKASNLNDVDKYLKKTEETIELARESFLEWDIENIRAEKQALNDLKSNIASNTSLLGQTQITNQVINTLSTQMDALLSMTLKGQKLVMAEKSFEHSVNNAEQKKKEKEFDDFWFKKSMFEGNGILENNLYHEGH